jgi:hypothetical protein
MKKWKKKTIKQFSGERLYYMRDTRSNGIVGNCVMWWRKNNSGYTCNLDDAEIYSEAKAMKMHENMETDRPYPKDIIDRITYRHVDQQKLDHLEYEEIEDAPQKSAEAVYHDQT